MQLNDWEKRCLAMLSKMMSGSGVWDHGTMQMYQAVLQSLGEEASQCAVQWAVLNEEWRPAPAKLRKIAAKLYSPLPPVGQLWTEMWHKAVARGWDHPRWTHPVIGDIVKAIGGWRYLRSVCWGDSDPRFKDNLQRRFEQAYADLSDSWWQTVADQVHLPPGERDPHFFPPKQHVFSPPRLLPSDVADAQERREGIPPIEEVRARLRAMEAGSIGNGAKNGKEAERG